MPKRITTRCTIGVDCRSNVFRTGHMFKCKKNESNNVVDQIVLFAEEMEKINKNFFQPFFNDPLTIDLEKSYCDLLKYFQEQREIYSSKPDVLLQINFIETAMRSIRTDASQYFLKSLQNEALAREIETSIQGLLLHIYLLNSRITILSGFDLSTSLEGRTVIETANYDDPRYLMAQTQPDLQMINFLFPNEPTLQYYKKIKLLLRNSGLYENTEAISDDLKRFLDRYLIKYDLNKTLEQYIEENEDKNDDDNDEIIDDYEDIVEQDERQKAFLDSWKAVHGEHSVLSGSFSMETANIDSPELQAYFKKIRNDYNKALKKQNPCPSPNNEKPTGLFPYMSPGIGRLIPLDGCFSLNPVSNINLHTDNLQRFIHDEKIRELTEKWTYISPNAPVPHVSNTSSFSCETSEANINIEVKEISCTTNTINTTNTTNTSNVVVDNYTCK